MITNAANAAPVFVSHAGADAERAMSIACLLANAGVDTRIDRKHLTFGEGFLAFMNDALVTSSYCLLLWSRSAASSPWVTMEWEGALVRSVREKRGFLVVGRLEEIEVPALLQPRLWVDLFPDVSVGVRKLLDAWQLDRRIETISQKPVASVQASVTTPHQGIDLYLTSELFALTVPVCLSLVEPIAALVEQVVNQLALPKTWQHDGRIGVRFSYAFSQGDRVLVSSATLAEAGVSQNALLNLIVEMKAFAAESPTSGVLPRAVFRGGGSSPPDPTNAARVAFRAALKAAGLA